MILRGEASSGTAGCGWPSLSWWAREDAGLGTRRDLQSGQAVEKGLKNEQMVQRTECSEPCANGHAPESQPLVFARRKGGVDR